MEMQRNSHWIASILIAAAFSFGLAGSALAQNDTGTVGGTASGNASPGEIHPTGMPQEQQQGDVTYVSGGVGLDESAALRGAQKQWPLTLRFTGPDAAFVANVQVRIVDAKGATVLDTASKGPYMLVRLRPGRYTVHASYSGVDRSQAVTVRGNGSARASFAWQASR